MLRFVHTRLIHRSIVELSAVRGDSHYYCYLHSLAHRLSLLSAPVRADWAAIVVPSVTFYHLHLNIPKYKQTIFQSYILYKYLIRLRKFNPYRKLKN